MGAKLLAGAVTGALLLVPASVIVLGTPGPSFRCPAVSSSVGGNGVTVDPAALPAQIGVWNRDQLAIAATVINAAAQAGVDRWTQQLAVAVAMKESSLTNLNHGDAVRNDTIGVFQIGPEHGAYEDRMNPTWATQNFLTRLQAVPGYHSLSPSLAAHKAQRNADPDAYTSMWDDASHVLDGLANITTASSTTNTMAATQATTPTTGSYSLGNVKPVAQKVADALGPQFGITTIYGWRDPGSERYDQAGHPSGLALDFMINDIPHGDATGNQLADYLIANADSIGVRYIIWKQRSWTPARNSWKPMEDRGSPTQNHMDHVHLSLNPDANGVTGTAGDASSLSATTSNCSTTNTNTLTLAGNPGAIGAQGWAAPIGVAPGKRSFGYRMHPVYHVMKLHEGQDYGANCGTPIYATAAGTVTFAGTRGGYGHLITLDHGNGITSRYGHMYGDGLLVKVGDQVSAGQHIANVGNDGTSTACHLHFEIRTNNTPTDPLTWLNQHGVA